MSDFLFDKALPFFMVVISILCICLMLVWLPVHLINEDECLSKGYPETSTSIKLTGYCKNIEGVVTGVVDKL